MKYLVTLVGDGELTPWSQMTEAERQQLFGRFAEFSAACRNHPDVEIIAGEALQEPSTATSLRTRGGEVVLTEGPYAEAFEGFGGFYLMEVPNLDVLVDLVKLLPAYDMELRPVDDSMTG